MEFFWMVQIQLFYFFLFCLDQYKLSCQFLTHFLLSFRSTVYKNKKQNKIKCEKSLVDKCFMVQQSQKIQETPVKIQITN